MLCLTMSVLAVGYVLELRAAEERELELVLY